MRVKKMNKIKQNDHLSSNLSDELNQWKNADLKLRKEIQIEELAFVKKVGFSVILFMIIIFCLLYLSI